MRLSKTKALLAAAILCGSLAMPLAGCANNSSSQSTSSQQSSSQQDGASSSSATASDATSSSMADKDAAASSSATASDAAVSLPDGKYSVEVSTDSSMFRAEYCTLTVEDGTYQATLTLPGEGFSRLYFGTAEEAQNATEGVYDYYLNDLGKYTFDIPVETLNKELPIAAYGQRRNTWYDHTITFHAPDPNDVGARVDSTYPDVA